VAKTTLNDSEQCLLAGAQYMGIRLSEGRRPSITAALTYYVQLTRTADARLSVTRSTMIYFSELARGLFSAGDFPTECS